MKNETKKWIIRKFEQICVKLERGILSNKSLKCKIVFGPVRSRRLGHVVGINNVKSKICSYDCVYCPSGQTKCCSVCSSYCLSPFDLHTSVKNKIDELKQKGKPIDYIQFIGCGEPTLDSSLAHEISVLREFGHKIAVFTNSSLLWNSNIQETLMYADYVSVKIDTVSEETWKRINRPHRKLDHDHILEGIQRFSKKFRGTLTSETMLIRNINDSTEEIDKLSEYLNTLKHNASYFMTPLYPSSEKYAVGPDMENIDIVRKLIKKKVNNSVLLCCPETEEFFATDDFENELLGLLALHPVNQDAVKKFIKGNEGLRILDELLSKNSIKEIIHNGKKYYGLDEKLQTV